MHVRTCHAVRARAWLGRRTAFTFETCLRPCIGAALLALAGCQGVDVEKAMREAAAEATTAQASPPPRRPSPGASSTSTTATARDAAFRPPLATRDAKSLDALLAKRTTSGTDLIAELRALKNTARARDADHAMAKLWGQGRSGGGGDANLFTQAGLQLAKVALEKTLRAHLTFALQDALQAHMEAMTGDTQALARETVEFPELALTTPERKQRAVTLAGIVVATRLTARMLQEAQNDLKQLDAEYASLISARESAAVMLRGALTEGAATALPAPDLARLRAMASSMTVAEFSQDMGAQNLAIQHLKSVAPSQFAQLQAQNAKATRRSDSALRTLTGTAAFGALLAELVKDLVALANSPQKGELLIVLPLLKDLGLALPPVLGHAFGAITDNVSLRLQPARAFRITVNGQTESVAGAAEVFQALERAGALAAFQDAQFRDRSRGMLNNLAACDRVTAAQMLDAASGAEHRESLAAAQQLDEPQRFNFVRAVQADAAPAEVKVLDLALSADHRTRTTQSTLALAELQKQVAGGVDSGARAGFWRWNSEQLAALLFANREGSARYAMLEVGPVQIRPVPSPQSLAAYERLADACRLQDVDARPSPAPKPKPKPGAKRS